MIAFFLKYNGIFSQNCGYASPPADKAASAPPWLQAMKDGAEKKYLKLVGRRSSYFTAFLVFFWGGIQPLKEETIQRFSLFGRQMMVSF